MRKDDTTGTGRPLPSGDHFRLADWLVAPGGNALLRGTDVLHLEPRAMDVLVRLCLSAGDTVSSEQLLSDVWHGTFYGDNPVHKAVAQIRRALGDSSKTPRYIETVRGRGYRICVPVLIESNEGAHKGAGVATWPNGSPFRGLEPFDVGHEAIYHGRDDAIARVIAAVRQQRDAGRSLVLVVGHSGSGKTSLLQAGVVPMLLRGCDGCRIASWARCDPASEQAANPFEAIAHAMLRWTIGERPVFLPSEHGGLARQLAAQPAQVGARITAAFERARATGRHAGGALKLLLLIDPLEAVLAGTTQAPVQATRLDAAFAMLGTHPDVLVLCACRADFYPGLLTGLPLAMQLKGGSGHVDLSPLGVGELAQCVREPARAAALHFDRDPLTREQLDDRLIKDARQSPEMLPMLQHVLALLYERRDARGALTFAAYRDIGGLDGAIALHAEHVISALDDSARNALDEVLTSVATVSVETGAVLARRAPAAALASPPAARLVNALVDARLFVSDLSAGEPYFGVAHEALLRHWPRAAAWVERNRRGLQLHARLRLAAQRWQEEGRRGDLLLRSRRLAAEATQLSPGRLSSLETAYVAASLHQLRRVRGLTFTVAALMVTLALTTAVLAARAELAREEAEVRRQQTDELLDFALGDLADRLRPIGRLDILGGVARQVLDTLPATAPSASDPDGTLRRTRALRTLAEVLVVQGELADAARALAEARSKLAALADSPALGFERSQIDYWEGLIAYREKRLAAARVHWESYAAQAQALRESDPGNPAWILEESYAFNNLGVLAKEQGEHRLATGAFRASLDLKRDYLALEPEASSALAELADSLSWLADALDRSGQLRDAAPLMHEQEAILAEARASSPRDANIAHQHALAQVRAGLLDAALGDADDAHARLRAGVIALQALSHGDPSNRTWLRDAAYAQAQLGWLMAMMGHRDGGLQHLQQAREHLQPLVALEHAPAEWHRLAAMTDLRLAVLRTGHVPAGTTDRAIAQAVGRLEVLASELGGDADTRAAWAQGLLVQGDWLAARGDPDRAATHWRAAVATLVGGARTESPDRVIVEPLVLALARLRDPDQGRWREALNDTGFAHPAYIADPIPSYFQGSDR